MLSRKIHTKTFMEMRADRYYKRRVENYDELKLALMEKVEEDWFERHVFSTKERKLAYFARAHRTKKTNQSQPISEKTKT